MKTLILGASPIQSRYSNIVTNRLVKAGHEVVLVGNRIGEIAGQPIQRTTENVKDIHTVTLYLNEYNQKAYENFILELKPKRVIFNPGAENPKLMARLKAQDIDAFEACTLVMLSSDLF
ncbi:MAG: CoA-binding protein [Cytophagales bacterium]|nr:CoA-binding protein [Cytophagales bacterium]